MNNKPMLGIEPASASNALAIGRVWAQSWQQAYAGIVPEDYLMKITPDQRTGIVQSALKTPQFSEEMFLFTVDGVSAGTACVSRYRDDFASDIDGEIPSIYFLQEYWGKGFSGEAMQFCLERLRERGAQNVFLWVLESNGRARRFYEKHGFSPTGAKKEIIMGHPLVEVKYFKKL